MRASAASRRCPRVASYLVLAAAPGGSGTFFYVAAAIKSGGGFRGTNAVPLGDRAAPRDIRIANGTIVVRYADRRAGEPMTAPPSVDRMMVLVLTAGRLTLARSGVDAPGGGTRP